MLKRPLLRLIVAAMLLVEGSCVASGRSDLKSGHIDFAPLYRTARAVHVGSSIDYDSSKIQGVDSFIGPNSRPLAPSVIDLLHPPLEVLLFLPLTFLSYEHAYATWSVCNLLLLWLVPLVLWKFIPRLHLKSEAIAVVYGLSFPVIACLFEGQDSILLLLLISLSFASLAKGRDRRAGVFLALGLFKFHLVLPLVAAWIIVRNWRAVTGFLLGFASLLLASLGLVGTKATLGYIPFLFHFGQHISVHASEKTATMPNLRGLVSSIAGSFASTRGQSMIVIGLSAVLLVLMLRWSSQFRTLPIAVQYSFVILVTSLISYHYYIHNSIILVIPLLLMANHFAAQDADPLLRRIFAATAVSICLTMTIAFVGVMLLEHALGVLLFEHAMPLVAIETLVMAGVIFAIPYRTRSRVSTISERSVATAG